MDWNEEVYQSEKGGWIYSVTLGGHVIFEAFWSSNYEPEDVLQRGQSFFAKQLSEALSGRG